MQFCLELNNCTEVSWVNSWHCNHHSCCQSTLIPAECVILKEGALRNTFRGYLFPTPLCYITCIIILPWNFVPQLCLTTSTSKKFKALQESELVLKSCWSWGKHPWGCQKPRCPSLWQRDTFSAQRETEWRGTERERARDFSEVRKMRSRKDLKCCSQGEQLLNACYVSVWCGVCSSWSWLTSSLSASTPPQPTDKWPSTTSR